MTMHFAGVLLLFFSLVFSNYSHASSNVLSMSQLLEQVESISPEIQKAKTNLEIVKQKLVQAGQIPNPEIGIGDWSGRAGGKKWGQTDINLTQPIELGGKRSSRIQVAEAEIKQAEVELTALTAEIRMKAIFSLYRLRQLNDEIAYLKEAKDTFAHLVQNYKNRPQLSPEQSTSMFVFDLAEKDYELLLSETISELNSLDSEIRLLTGYSSEQLQSILPKRSKSWPDSNSNKELNSPSLRILSAQAELSENELKLAKADVWPTVNIGPSYTTQHQFGEKANIWGVVVSFPIPVLNQNNGARAIAAKSISANRKIYEIEKRLLEVRRENLRKTYLNSSAVLEKQADNSDLQKKHSQIESNFLKGLISSPLVIESHRQMFDNRKLYHQREIETLNVYYQLVLLEGGKVEGF